MHQIMWLVHQPMQGLKHSYKNHTAMPVGIFLGRRTVYGILPSSSSFAFLSSIPFSTCRKNTANTVLWWYWNNLVKSSLELCIHLPCFLLPKVGAGDVVQIHLIDRKVTKNLQNKSNGGKLTKPLTHLWKLMNSHKMIIDHCMDGYSKLPLLITFCHHDHHDLPLRWRQQW